VSTQVNSQCSELISYRWWRDPTVALGVVVAVLKIIEKLKNILFKIE
jgi:hypothetical protein